MNALLSSESTRSKIYARKEVSVVKELKRHIKGSENEIWKGAEKNLAQDSHTGNLL